MHPRHFSCNQNDAYNGTLGYIKITVVGLRVVLLCCGGDAAAVAERYEMYRSQQKQKAMSMRMPGPFSHFDPGRYMYS